MPFCALNCIRHPTQACQTRGPLAQFFAALGYQNIIGQWSKSNNNKKKKLQNFNFVSQLR